MMIVLQFIINVFIGMNRSSKYYCSFKIPKNVIHVFFLLLFLSFISFQISHWSSEHCILIESNQTHSICRCRPVIDLSICTILAIGPKTKHYHNHHYQNHQQQQQRQSTYNLTSLVCHIIHICLFPFIRILLLSNNIVPFFPFVVYPN